MDQFWGSSFRITQKQHLGTSQCSLPWLDPDGPVLTEEPLGELFPQGISPGTCNSRVDPNWDAGGRSMWGLVQMKGFQGCQIDFLACKGHSDPRQSQFLTGFSCLFSQCLFPPSIPSWMLCQGGFLSLLQRWKLSLCLIKERVFFPRAFCFPFICLL